MLRGSFTHHLSHAFVEEKFPDCVALFIFLRMSPNVR